MKISKSKKQLAEIIHENGGWRDGAKFAAQGGNHGHIGFASVAPVRNDKVWDMTRGFAGKFLADRILPNWHQTILSRDEYFHLYPVAETAPKPEIQSEIIGIAQVDDINVVESKPTIEQLAADYRNLKDYADRKQQEADAAKADAEAKLAELVAAGKALGLVLSVTDTGPELVIHDWRDLQVGDIIECIGSWEREDTDGRRFAVTAIDPRKAQVGRPIRIEVPEVSCPGTWGFDFKFIRRPSKGEANA